MPSTPHALFPCTPLGKHTVWACARAHTPEGPPRPGAECDRSGASCCSRDGQGWALCPSARPPWEPAPEFRRWRPENHLEARVGAGPVSSAWLRRPPGPGEISATLFPRGHLLPLPLDEQESAAGKPGVGASVGCCGPAGPSSWRLCLRGRAIMDAAHQKEGQAQDTAVHAPALRGSDSFPDVNFPATGLF